ncbi:MAG: Rieske 2Fe-2S domain-containing protein [Pseudomonadales bacterium]
MFCPSVELAGKPLSKQFLGQRLVAYRTTGGKPVVMDARCSHMRADLGCGRVVNDALQCPLHHWEYGPNGRCRHIPASDVIPAFAGQRCYPTQERAGFVFVFNGLKPLFPLPFFSSASPDELVAAKPFSMELDCPWHTVGANHFDLQHFRAAHDRKPIGEHRVDCPEPFARRASCCFLVAANSLQDRLTRRFAGDRVTMTIVDWCGTLMFVTAEFRNTTSYGLVNALPLDEHKVRVVVIVFVRKSRRLLLGTLVDSLNASVRRRCIKAFLQSDFRLLSNVQYDAKRFIECDRELAGYFRWLRSTANGIPYPPTEP